MLTNDDLNVFYKVVGKDRSCCNVAVVRRIYERAKKYDEKYAPFWDHVTQEDVDLIEAKYPTWFPRYYPGQIVEEHPGSVGIMVFKGLLQAERFKCIAEVHVSAKDAGDFLQVIKVEGIDKKPDGIIVTGAWGSLRRVYEHVPPRSFPFDDVGDGEIYGTPPEGTLFFRKVRVLT